MRKYLRTIAAAAGLGLSLLAAVGFVLPSVSLAQVAATTSVDPRQPEPRAFQTQQVAYIRTTIAFSSCVQASNVCTMKVKNASLPYNAAVLRVTANVMTAFNSTTSDVIIVGTTAASANELVSSTCNIHAQGLVACTVAAGANSAIGATTAQSGTNGGFDIFVKWTGGGGTPTAGLMSLIVEYVMPNDALCTQVPLGATAAGC